MGKVDLPAGAVMWNASCRIPTPVGKFGPSNNQRPQAPGVNVRSGLKVAGGPGSGRLPRGGGAHAPKVKAPPKVGAPKAPKAKAPAAPKAPKAHAPKTTTGAKKPSAPKPKAPGAPKPAAAKPAAAPAPTGASVQVAPPLSSRL